MTTATHQRPKFTPETARTFDRFSIANAAQAMQALQEAGYCRGALLRPSKHIKPHRTIEKGLATMSSQAWEEMTLANFLGDLIIELGTEGLRKAVCRANGSDV